MSRLKQQPIDRLKIDRQVIQGLEGSKKDQAITRSMISLTQNLGLGLVAERIETKAPGGISIK